MKQAQIQCLCREYHISDLGLTLKQGDVVVWDEAAARGSVHLEHARRIGAVAVQYVQPAQVVRSREEKSEAPRQAARRMTLPESQVINLPPEPTPRPQAETKDVAGKPRRTRKSEKATEEDGK